MNLCTRLLKSLALLFFSLTNITIVQAGSAIAEEDSIVLTFLGTGAPRPSLKRYGPTIMVEAGEHRFLIDAGWGVRQRLYRVGGFKLITGIEHILITHLHYDHTLGLADIWLTGWLYGRRVPLNVMGPPGIASMLEHTQRAFDWDLENRRLVGVPMQGTRINAIELTPGIIFDKDGLKITAFEVEHGPIDRETGELLKMAGMSFGYRVDYKGRSVVFSGDTRPSEELVRQSQNVDVLIHETQVPSPGNSKEAILANVSLSVHTSPEQAAKIFNDTKPRIAVYSHIIPPNRTEEEIVNATRPNYKGPLRVAHDFMKITIGEEIVFSEAALIEDEAFEKSEVFDK